MNFGSLPEWAMFIVGLVGAGVSYGLTKGLVKGHEARISSLEESRTNYGGRIGHLETDTAVCQSEIRNLKQRKA